MSRLRVALNDGNRVALNDGNSRNFLRAAKWLPFNGNQVALHDGNRLALYEEIRWLSMVEIRQNAPVRRSLTKALNEIALILRQEKSERAKNVIKRVEKLRKDVSYLD